MNAVGNFKKSWRFWSFILGSVMGGMSLAAVAGEMAIVSWTGILARVFEAWVEISKVVSMPITVPVNYLLEYLEVDWTLSTKFSTSFTAALISTAAIARGIASNERIDAGPQFIAGFVFPSSMIVGAIFELSRTEIVSITDERIILLLPSLYGLAAIIALVFIGGLKHFFQLIGSRSTSPQISFTTLIITILGNAAAIQLVMICILITQAGWNILGELN